MKKFLLALFVLLVLLGGAGAYFGSPVYALYRIGTAFIEPERPAQLEEYVDFPQLRGNLKRSLGSMALQKLSLPGIDPSLTQVISSRITQPVVDHIVERHVTPEGLIDLSRRARDENSSPVTLFVEELATEAGALKKSTEKLEQRASSLLGSLGLPGLDKVPGLGKLTDAVTDSAREVTAQTIEALVPEKKEQAEPEPIDIGYSDITVDFENRNHFALSVAIKEDQVVSVTLVRRTLLHWELIDLQLLLL